MTEKTKMRQKIVEQYTCYLSQLNKEAREHSQNVADLCQMVAKEMGMDEERAFRIGLLHDIGKMYIPGRILKKNWILNRLEREIIDLHAYYGYRLLKDIGEPPEIYVPVLFHHGFWKPWLCQISEPIDEDIMRFIFLIHSVDMYDAMSTKRVYHEPMEDEYIFKMLTEDQLSSENLICVLKQVVNKKQKSKVC